ncbi:MAG: lysylphosphatidylglycerol synthase domain-containing protein [Gemmatimonadaceae bacterium]
MTSRFRHLWYLIPLGAGALLALAWVRATGGASLRTTLGQASPPLVLSMLGVTASWLVLRFLRWQFLLRRIGVRLPIRPTLASYIAALPGTATPAYLGEVARAVFLRRRFGTPLRPVIIVLVLERLFDVAALSLLAFAKGGATGIRIGAIFFAAALALAALLVPIARRSGIAPRAISRLRDPATLLVSLAASVLAWGIAGALYTLAALALGSTLSLADGVGVFARSTLLGAITLAPAGVGATGSIAIVQLQSLGLALASAVSVVTLVRLTSTGAALAVGCVFLWRELRGTRAPIEEGIAHFDTIAQEYNAQWSPHVWDLLLDRKLSLMAEALPSPPAQAGIGVDLGCGLGLQTAEMRRRGFNVVGLEPSVGLLQQKRAGGAPVVAGDALNIPLGTATIDFVFVIGVLHHLPGRDAQSAALREIARVLKPGGMLLVHESNPRNPLFRFYMGYLFPIMKSIDEGTEWWIDPRSWADAKGFRLETVRYFTFLPDFTPRFLMRPAMMVERWLERGPTRDYSAHYLSVMRRGIDGL